MSKQQIIQALANIVEACQTKEYRDPLTHAQIADMAQELLRRVRS